MKQKDPIYRLTEVDVQVSYNGGKTWCWGDSISPFLLLQSVRVDVRKVLDMFWEEEERHYNECEPRERKNHIFKTLRRLQRALPTK
jgi:hypothetical protein